jgi:hypothetical protein|tara:strand:+ start:1509 stop:1808 length:300 start_codon:yes stop_codon:yes gene_type:complete
MSHFSRFFPYLSLKSFFGSQLDSVLALLRSAEAENTFEVQCKGSSYEMTVSEHSERTWTLMESCRRAAQQRALASKGGAMQTLGDVCESLDPEIEQASL